MSKKQEKSEQLEIKFSVVKSTEVDGIEMGVLSNGTPFLTGRGLARFCGIAASTLFEWGENAPLQGDRLRMGKMASLLAGQGFDSDRLFVKIPFDNQLEVNAYPDSVCMAFLEYYAFEAGRYCTEEAITHFRLLAKTKLCDFIYQKTGYDPKAKLLGSWKHYHDRLLLNPLPNGYFSVFRETSGIVLAWIQGGLVLDDHTVPDISVGRIWNNYWKDNGFDAKYGNRIKYPHAYPDYFPQAKANEAISAYIFPLAALGVFRLWLENEYLPNKFPTYLSDKVKKGAFPASKKEAMIKALTPSLPKQISA